MPLGKAPKFEKLMAPEGSEGGGRNGEVDDLAALTCLQAAPDMATALRVFFDSPEYFTKDGRSEVRSSTAVTDAFFEVYCKKILLVSDLDDQRFALLDSSLSPKPPKQGFGPDGKIFVRKPPAPRGTMQTMQVFFPEIAEIILNELEKQKRSLPDNWTWSQIGILATIFLSCDITDDMRLLSIYIEDEKISKKDLLGLSNWLAEISGQQVQPILQDFIGKTDLGTNVIITLKAKVDNYLMAS